MKYKIYFLVLLLSLTACASNKWESSEVEEVFVTDIKPSGLKIFNYSLTNTMAQASGNTKRGGSNKGTGKHGSVKARVVVKVVTTGAWAAVSLQMSPV